jgi:hypothetical protein
MFGKLTAGSAAAQVERVQLKRQVNPCFELKKLVRSKNLCLEIFWEISFNIEPNFPNKAAELFDPRCIYVIAYRNHSYSMRIILTGPSFIYRTFLNSKTNVQPLQGIVDYWSRRVAPSTFSLPTVN